MEMNSGYFHIVIKQNTLLNTTFYTLPFTCKTPALQLSGLQNEQSPNTMGKNTSDDQQHRDENDTLKLR